MEKIEINNDTEMLLDLIKLKYSALIKCRILLIFHFTLSLLLILMYPEILQHQAVFVFSLLINLGLLFDCFVKEFKLHRLKEKLSTLK
jgi:hypothetical protein